MPIVYGSWILRPIGCLVAYLLATAGTLKVVHWSDSGRALSRVLAVTLRAPVANVTWIAHVLPLMEIAVAIAMMFGAGRVRRLGHWSALLLGCAFVGVRTRILSGDADLACSCFGRLSALEQYDAIGLTAALVILTGGGVLATLGDGNTRSSDHHPGV